MLIVAPIASVASTRSHRVVEGLLPAGTGSYVTGHMGRGHKTRPENPIFPMAYLVEQDANTHLRPHFHDADQFQVIVAGSGTMGKHPVASLSVHYTNACTPYGPIEAGPEGVSYFTLRNSWDSGAKFLPESRTELLQRKRTLRSSLAGPIDVPYNATLANGTATEVRVAIEPEADGLAAWVMCAAPAGRMTNPAADSRHDQFWIVVGGTALHDNQPLAPNSVVFVSRDEAPPAIQAGSTGAAMLVVQYPRHD